MRVLKNSSNRNSKFPPKFRSKAHHDIENCPHIRTSGEVFQDGASISLLREPETGSLSLLLSEGKERRIAPKIGFRDNVYLPASINQSIIRVMGLPTKCGHFEKTGELFRAVRELFTSRGFPEDVALPTTYFSFATWFTKFLPAAPCLLIGGSRPEVVLSLELLSCLVRHPLPLGDVTRSSLCSLPMHLEPTLLIDQQRISRSTLGLLGSSNSHTAYVPRKDGLVNICCSKALSCQGTVNIQNFGDSALQINIPPSRGRLPILFAREKEEITTLFQSRFLAYRVRNICKVRDSQCDFPEFDSRIRILGRVLGAPIVDDPELQADLGPLLSNYQDGVLASKWLDLRCVVIEALLVHCHENSGEKLHVGRLTITVNLILRGRGETIKYEPESIGAILREHGFSPKRNRQGYAIFLNESTRRLIHQLAVRFDLATTQADAGKCLHCTEILN
jgi:hypothetical protein